MKLIFLKKGVLITLVALVLAGVAFGICAGALASASSKGDRVIVIDAGHGGLDAGVLGTETNVKESEVNLAIAKLLKGYFSEAGFEVVMTRKDSGGLYGSTVRGFKMRDMKKRREIIEESGADMVISIHQNVCPLKSKRGGQIYYDKSSESGKALAESIKKALDELSDGEKLQNGEKSSKSGRTNAVLTGDYFMLKCTESPSVIVECGFLSNPDDEKLLCSEEFRRQLAYSIFKGAVSYFG